MRSNIWHDLASSEHCPSVVNFVWKIFPYHSSIVHVRLVASVDDRCKGSPSLLDAVGINTAHVYVNAAQLELVLLVNFKENILNMDQDFIHMVAASKVPMLKPGEYEIWRMRIEQYIQMIDYALWEVIENGATLPKTQVVEGVTIEMPVTPAKEKTQRRLEDAKKLMEVVERRFGRNAATKKTQRNLLKQQYENFTAPSSEMLDQTFDELQKLVKQLELLEEKLSQEDVNQKQRNDQIMHSWLSHLQVLTQSSTSLHKNFMPPTPDLSFTGLDEFVNKHIVKNCKAMSSEKEPKDQGVIDSGCSRHMTGNMSYLTDYEEINGGYVAFGGNPKGGKITRKYHKVKVIRCDNGIEFKNSEMNQFCEMKGILRQFSVGRTPQQNGVAERRNRTLIEVARTMLADSKTPTLNFMRPFGCHVAILNTIDHLGKFDGKADEGSGPDWLFDIDALTRTISYEPIVAGTPSNGFVGTKASDNVDPKSSNDDGSKLSSDDGKKIDEDPRKENEYNKLPFDPNMPSLEDVSTFDFSRNNEDDGVVA
nr:hypothetical protein [Tanacetum cinerariifolium]